MPKLPRLTGQEFVKFLKYLGFEIIRQKGSHVRLKALDGRITTIPIHKGKQLPIGLIRKIIRDDLELHYDEFIELYNKFQNKEQ
jgi:predicted RNA binding protein YcfA (HicA-like mRNA interferase family)